jgi:hypothetical protein
MRRYLLLTLLGVVVAVVIGATLALGHQSASPITAPAQVTAPEAVQETTPPAQPGAAYPGSQECLFSTRDQDYSVFALITETASCNEWSQSLAMDGSYWTPVGTGGPAGNTVCTLTADGMTITVTEWSSVDEPIGGSVAQGLCQSEEQNGWTPQ